MGEKVFEKHFGGTGKVMLRADAENVLDGTTEHTTSKSSRIRALKVGDRVDWEGSRAGSGRSRLVSLHRLFCRGRKRTSGSWDTAGRGKWDNSRKLSDRNSSGR